MKFLKDLFGGDPRQFGMLFALVALVAFFQVQTQGLMLTSANVMNLLNGNAYILVLAIGMVLVIIAGNIDLSVGSVAAFAGILVALALREAGWRSVSLGNMLPLSTIGAAIQQMRPKLAWISLSTPDDAEDFVNQYATFEESIPPETKVIVGGRGLDESLRDKASGIVYCVNLQQLAASTKDWIRASLAT